MCKHCGKCNANTSCVAIAVSKLSCANTVPLCQRISNSYKHACCKLSTIAVSMCKHCIQCITDTSSVGISCAITISMCQRISHEDACHVARCFCCTYRWRLRPYCWWYYVHSWHVLLAMGLLRQH